MTHAQPQPGAEEELTLLDRYWRAANYLSVGQIYLMDNPCCANRYNPNILNRACWATGAPRPV